MNESTKYITPKRYISEARGFLAGQVATVFETMLSIKIVPTEKKRLSISGERITGTLGFAGDDIKGVFYLDLPAETANHLTLIMLGQTPPAVPAERDVNDVIGELSNMIAGGLKSWLSDSGAPCAISTPSIIRGTSYLIEAPPDAKCESLVFEFEGGIVAVELHIQFD